MIDHLDPYRFVKVSQMFGRITSTWPPRRRDTPCLHMFNDFMWGLGLFSNLLCFAFLILKMFHREDDPVILAKLISKIGIVGDSCLHLILVRIQWPRLQNLVHEVIAFLRIAKVHEKKMCRKYIKRYLRYEIVLYGLFAAGIGAFSFSPWIQKKRFPIDVWYPFSTEPILIRAAIYFFQYITIAQTLVLVTSDAMIMTLFWYSSARLELLGMELQEVNDEFQIRNCIKKHQEIIRFVGETQLAIRLLSFVDLFTLTVTLVCAGIQLSHYPSSTVLSQFLLIICVAIVRIFGGCWAGDDLAEMGCKLSWSIYQSPAIAKSFHLGKTLSIMITRSQRTLTITVWAKRLRFSLEFLTEYIIKVMSFFMTLRAVIDRYL